MSRKTIELMKKYGLTVFSDLKSLYSVLGDKLMFEVVVFRKVMRS